MSKVRAFLSTCTAKVHSFATTVQSQFTARRVTLFFFCAAPLTFFLSYQGAFQGPAKAVLPVEFAKLGGLPVERLTALVTDKPAAVSNVVFFKGLDSVVVYSGASASGTLTRQVNTAKLTQMLDAAKVKHEERPAGSESQMLVWAVFLNLFMSVGLGACLLRLLMQWSRSQHEDLYNGTPMEDGLPPGTQLSTRGPAHRTTAQTPEGQPLTWDDVAGNPEAIDRLKRIERFLRHAKWFKLCGAKTPKGILLLGPPGTGKTLLARILAWVSGCNFLECVGSDFEEKLVGVGASRWREWCEKGIAMWKKTGKPTLMFIDEMECIGKKRGEREHTETLTAMLASIDGFTASPGLIFVAATNHPEVLDPALVRPGRFGDQVSVDPPDLNAREAIFKIKTRKMQLAADVNLRVLAMKAGGFTGAQIEHVCNEAAVYMAERVMNSVDLDSLSDAEMEALPRLVTQADLVKAVDYVMMGDELLSKMASQTPEDRRNLEIHEAGHAYVNHKVGGRPPASLSRIMRSKSLGVFTWAQDKDCYGYSEEQLKGIVKVYLGGQAAQKQILNYRDTGPSDDYKQANRQCRMMVGVYGMSKLGPVSLPLDDLGFPTKQVSEYLLTKFDEAWMELLAECEADVKRIVEEGKDIINRLADAMELKEKLNGDEITRICNGEDPAVVLAETA